MQVLPDAKSFRATVREEETASRLRPKRTSEQLTADKPIIALTVVIVITTAAAGSTQVHQLSVNLHQPLLSTPLLFRIPWERVNQAKWSGNNFERAVVSLMGGRGL
jgi:hypothetical protein